MSEATVRAVKPLVALAIPKRVSSRMRSTVRPVGEPAGKIDQSLAASREAHDAREVASIGKSFELRLEATV